ncbi:YhbY family RNA-binding protein [Candidatus Pacearchaeota archaeon]|nr:YhbY family RNA-binding protein [Candidatus Pacearchaeota archaeon]
MGQIGQAQIGKQGITDNFIESLKNQFKNSRDVKISVLRAARGEGKQGKQDVQKFKEEILNKLGENFKARVIGFTISVKRLRRGSKKQ